MTSSSPIGLLQYFPYEDAIKKSVETLWKYWLTDDDFAEQAVLQATAQAYERYRDSISGPRENFGETIKRDLRLVFSNAKCDGKIKSGLLRGCSKKLVGAFSLNNHAQNGGGTSLEGVRERYFDMMASILDHDLKSAFISPGPDGQSYSLFLAGQGETYLFEDLLSRCRQSTDPAAQVSNCLAARDAQGRHTSLTLAILGGHTSVVEAIMSSWEGSEMESEQLYDTQLLISNLSASKDVRILAKLLESRLQFDRPRLFEKILFGTRADMLSCFLEAHDADTAKRLFTTEIVSKLMKDGDSDAWRTCCTYWRSRSHDKTFCRHIFGERPHSLLHYAVRLRRYDVVCDLLDDHPKSAGHVDEKQRYPLWYLLNRDTEMPISDDNSDLEEIRKAIVRALIKENEAWMVDLIVQCSQPVESGHGVADHGLLFHDIFLDFSTFDTGKHDFAQYIAQLPTGTDILSGMSFEQVLHTVKFPKLRQPGTGRNEDDLADHDEVGTTLQWLRQSMGVTEIKKLIVPDRRFAPHDLAVIHRAVQEFCIQSMDWMYINICLSAPDWSNNDQKPPEVSALHTLREIVLYTDGSENTIRQWLGGDGLASLPRACPLEKVRIHVLEDTINQRKANQVQDRLRSGLKFLKDRNCKVKVDIRPWTSARDEREVTVENRIFSPVPRLAPFIEHYNSISQRAGSARTKIAIIDNGMMWSQGEAKSSVHLQACKQVQDGKSFLNKGGSGFQWYLAGASWHGTQMACIISSLDPMCKLYIAQVCAPGVGLTAAAVRKAILWAIQHDVDIISLSLSLEATNTEEQNKFTQAINAASAKNIVIISSTVDEGHNKSLDNTLLARYKGQVLIIGAVDHLGNRIPYSTPEGFDFAMQGRLQAIGQLNYIETQEGREAEGSSIATAIAAGLSSLMISCHRLACRLDSNLDSKTKPDEWKRSLLAQKMKMMQDSETYKYVNGDKLLGTEKLDQDMSEEQAEQAIKKHFQLDD